MHSTFSALFSLVAVSLVLLTGCDRGKTPTAKHPEAPTARPIALTFWHIMNYSGPREVLASAVQRFEAANPDTTVTIQTFKNDAYKTKLAIEMASGTPPDVLFTWGGGPLAEYARAGRVLDLTPHVEKDGWRQRFIDKALAICMADERVYAVPLDLSAVVLWHNRELFEQAGVTPPATLEDLLAVGKVFRERDTTPMSLGNLNQWPGAFHFVYLATRRGGAQLFLDAAGGKGSARFDNPAFAQAGSDVRRLVDAKMFPLGFNGIDAGSARTKFLSGKAAMYTMGTWLVARVVAENPEFMSKLDCVPYPAVSGGKGDPSTVVGGVNCGFAVSAGCKHPEKAVELLRYLTAPEVASEWCDIGRIPALQVTAEDEAKLPAPTRKALSLLKAAKRIQPYYDQYLPPRMAVEHKKTTQKLFAGTMTGEEAAKRMAESAAKRAAQARGD